MKRFKNILVVYDFFPGCDETLQKAVDLAARNDARLTVVNVSNSVTEEAVNMAERERLLHRVVAGLSLAEDRKTARALYGPPVERVLDVAKDIDADLIIAPEENKGFYARVLGLDTSTELLRQAHCPTWIMRPQSSDTPHRVVVAIDAGKPHADACPAVRRVLEIGASIAALENAELHVVYAWEFEGAARDTIGSELPSGRYEALCEQAHEESRGKIVDLIRSVLGDTADFEAIPLRGDARRVVTDYVKRQNATLLIVDGHVDGAIKAALKGNTTTHLAKASPCSVVCTRAVLPERNAAARTAA